MALLRSIAHRPLQRLCADPVHRPPRRLCTSPTGGVPIPAITESILRQRWTDLDPEADRILEVLHASDAPLIWHKHSSFLDHLREVWVILCTWQQPRDTCRLGLLLNQLRLYELLRPEARPGPRGGAHRQRR